MSNRERIYHQISQEPENVVMGLSHRARNHLVRYSARVFNNPVVEEIVDVHGEEADELGQVLKLEGSYALVLKERQVYVIKNPTPKSPNDSDLWLFIVHNHPFFDSI